MTNRDFEKFMDSGISSLQKGDILAARGYFEKAFKADDNVWVRNNLAYVYYETKNSLKAYKILEPLGSPYDDSFYWAKEEPTSTVGKLWAKALVFIGRATVSGRKEKVAVIAVIL
ncbi:tetratricopeptide repeat protein [Carboxydothermus pertinax]|nr:tetratricopeptide repeat protein [Carboxydothermus pertinax]